MGSRTKAALALQVQALEHALHQETAKRARLEGQLTDARDQQAATSAILGVMSTSRADVQPVFDAIAESAVRLCGGVNGAVFTSRRAWSDIAARSSAR